MTTRETNDGGTEYQLPDGYWLEEHWCCRRCLDQGRVREADEQFSLGIYAGKYCDECWENSGYRQDGPAGFDPMDAGEAYGPEDY